MARRIEIELSGVRDDGQWTWHAPGARLPRGVLAGKLLPPGARAGDVLRAEAEFTLDGIDVVAVLAPRDARSDARVERIEVIGHRSSDASVTFGGSHRLPPDEREGTHRRDAQARGSRPGGRFDRGPRSRRPAGSEHTPSERSDGARAGRTAGSERDTGARRHGAPERNGSHATRSGASRDQTGSRRGRPARLEPATIYRNAALAELRPEQLPVAEQLLRGGIPAVRQAIAEQNERAERESRPGVSPEPLIAMAEELLPRMNLASWKDRAIAARDAGDALALRELRFVVAGASAVLLDDEGREMLSALKARLDARVTALRKAWEEKISAAIEAGDLQQALEVSARPPEPAARVPAALAVTMATSAGEAMGPDTEPEGWLGMLDAVVASPVRRNVRPRGIPRDADERLLAAARKAAGQVPELARLLGIPMPPPPGPRKPVRQAR
ncbi:MAG: hypothetical protein ACYCUF_00335 [Acidimicrobiales bacterium]